MGKSPVVEVANYSTKTEADFAASALESNDIESYVRAGGTGGEQVGAPSVAGFSVFVEADQLEEAKSLLASVYPENDLSHVPFAERQKEGARLTSPVPVLIVGAFLGALFVGAVLMVQSYRTAHFTGTRFYGDIKEKKRGTWDTYESGALVRRQYDRNYDGKPHITISYHGTHIDRTEYDDNFDGKTDVWIKYEDGNPSRAEYDTDFNGIPDEVITSEKGVRVRLECKPNGASPPIRIEFFENGVKVRQLDELDAAGQLTREITYDAFGNETSSKKVKVGA